MAANNAGSISLQTKFDYRGVTVQSSTVNWQVRPSVGRYDLSCLIGTATGTPISIVLSGDITGIPSGRIIAYDIIPGAAMDIGNFSIIIEDVEDNNLQLHAKGFDISLPTEATQTVLSISEQTYYISGFHLKLLGSTTAASIADYTSLMIRVYVE